MNMKRTSLLISTALLLSVLSGCSDSDAPQKPADGEAIRLSAVVPNGTRAAATTTATIKEFTVYAFTEGSVLMDGVKVTRQGGSWTYSPEAYWPVNPVNFYAYSPDINVTSDITGEGGGHIPGYICSGDVDLLYSVRKNVVQQAAPVALNFRHALSKASIMMSSKNPRIKVVVSYISLRNIYHVGSFAFPQESTLSSTPDVVGTWSHLSGMTDLITFTIIDQADKVTLTPTPTDYTLHNLDRSYVIPQDLVDVSLSAAGYAGTYIEVDCEIFDTATGAKLWPNANTPSYMLVAHTETGRIVYPATSGTVKQYKPGHAYVYNIEINNPNVLDKIEFDVTVDDYSIDEIR